MQMRKAKKLAAALVTATMVTGAIAPVSVAYADSRKVITLGADLSDERQAAILKYFGVGSQAVETIYVNNTDERNLLSSFVPLDVIGTRTLSCAYVNPTTSGGIQVKTANLTWVTSNMIASALSTSGVRNCEVIAACPIPVSGTGALAGVLKAYETAAGEVLSATRKEIAAQEIVTTGDIATSITQTITEATGDPEAAQTIAQNAATQIVNDIKISVIEDAVEEYDEELISAIVDTAVSRAAQTLQAERDELLEISEQQKQELQKLAESIAAQQYQYDDVKETLERVSQNVNPGDVNVNVNVNNNNTAEGGDATVGDTTATSGDATALSGDADTGNAGAPELAPDSIFYNTDVTALGEDVKTDATTEEALTPTETEEQQQTAGMSDLPFEITTSDEGSFGGDGTDETTPEQTAPEQTAPEQPAEEQPAPETAPEAAPETVEPGENPSTGDITFDDGQGGDTGMDTPGDVLILDGQTGETQTTDGSEDDDTDSDDEDGMSALPDETTEGNDGEGNDGEGTESLPEGWAADEPSGDEQAAPKLAVGGTDKTFNGFSVKLYTDSEVVPASGSVTFADDLGGETVIDLSDSSAFGVLPDDSGIADSLGWDEAYEIHVLTANRGLGSGEYKVKAEIVFADADEDGKPVDGTEREAVTAEATLTYAGSNLVPASTDFVSPTVATLESYYPEGTSYAEVASSDEYVAVPGIYTLGEGTGSVELDLEDAGNVTITVTYFNEGGEALGEDKLAMAAF